MKKFKKVKKLGKTKVYLKCDIFFNILKNFLFHWVNLHNGHTFFSCSQLSIHFL